MKKSFTLIEVLIAVSLLVFLSFAVLSISSNSKKILVFLEKNKALNMLFSIIAANPTKEKIKTKDELKSSFRIKNKEVLKNLPQETIETKSILDANLSYDEEIGAFVYKIKAKSKKGTFVFYSVRR